LRGLHKTTNRGRIHFFVYAFLVYLVFLIIKQSKIRIRRDCNTLYGNIQGSVTPLSHHERAKIQSELAQ